jgi:hypothetical protein
VTARLLIGVPSQQRKALDEETRKLDLPASVNGDHAPEVDVNVSTAFANPIRGLSQRRLVWAIRLENPCCLLTTSTI